MYTFISSIKWASLWNCEFFLSNSYECKLIFYQEVIFISALSIAKIVIGILLLILVVYTIRSVQKKGTGEYNGSVGWLMFLITVESIALPIYAYFLLVY